MWTVVYLCSFFGISNLEELVLEQHPSFLRFSAALCTFPIPQHVAAAQGNAEHDTCCLDLLAKGLLMWLLRIECFLPNTICRQAGNSICCLGLLLSL